MSDHATSFTGRGIDVFAAAVVASSLELYAKTGIKSCRAASPKNLMIRAGQITGKRFKARDYLGAARAIRQWTEPEKLMAVATGEIK